MYYVSLLMLLNCGVGEDSWESLGLQGDATSPFEGDQPWDFFGRNDAKSETPVLWPPHAKSWLIGKDSNAGRDWGQEEKETTEDEMAGWHHWLDGHESQWTPGVDDGQGGLACCDSWGRKESDTTERLIWSDLQVWASYLLYTNLARVLVRGWLSDNPLFLFLRDSVSHFKLNSSGIKITNELV